MAPRLRTHKEKEARCCRASRCMLSRVEVFAAGRRLLPFGAIQFADGLGTQFKNAISDSMRMYFRTCLSDLCRVCSMMDRLAAAFSCRGGQPGRENMAAERAVSCLGRRCSTSLLRCGSVGSRR